MSQHELKAKLIADIQSGNDELITEAAKGLLAIGEYGDEPGLYLLQGGKAAFRLERMADAVILFYHGRKVARPHTLVWAELLVNRALACCRFGYYNEAVQDAQSFLEALHTLPAGARAWIPYAHHALAQSFDRMGDYATAAPHHSQAAELFSDPVYRSNSLGNLAYALAMCGRAAEAQEVLFRITIDELPLYYRFVHGGITRAVVLYHLGHFGEALAAGEQAKQLAADQEEAWAIPFAELHYWMSRSAWETGDRYRSVALAFHAAVNAEWKWHFKLRDMAKDWLEEIMSRGGIKGA